MAEEDNVKISIRQYALCCGSAFEWSYHGLTGPPYWGDHYPMCNGNEQSPIDIVTANTVGEFPWEPFAFEHYEDVPLSLELTNNGHSAQVSGTWTTNPYIHGGKLGGDYELAQFHIHWGSDDSKGSEHTVDGFEYAAEVHFVHWNKKYSSISEAVMKADGLAVLGVFLEAGTANTAYDDFFNGMANIINADDVTSIGPFAMAGLLPANTDDFWRYDGSLTTPTCNEIVTWTVFKDPVQVSSAQLATLRQLTDKHGDQLVDTFRPVQPLEGRTVYKGVEDFDWGYEEYNGPALWPDAFSTCSGTRQSPINIDTNNVEGTYPWNDFAFYTYDENPSSITLLNNGHTAQFSCDFGDSEASIRGGGLGDDEYVFLQGHFHWGSDDSQGSEHTVDGNKYPIELHLVHYNKKYGNAGEAIKNEDGLAVLGIFFEVGAANSNLDSIINGLASIHDPDTSTTITPFKLETLLPEVTSEFWRYKGSLTTPSCNEIVTWTVFKNTLTISSDQLAEFRMPMDKHGKSIVDNFRPPQQSSQTVYGMNTEFLWSYMGETGPNFWAGEYAMCGGDSQSPVDIVTSAAVGQYQWPEWNLQHYDTSATTWTMTNNKHTAQLSGEFADTPWINGGELGAKYTFAQLHFHWGSVDTQGSEHTVDGVAYPIECHLVHFKEEYGDIGSALEESDGLAVLGILFEISADDNPNLNSIIDGLADIVEPGTSTTVASFALNDLLPGDLDFYRYHGSLTTPTCNPIVTWTVFKETVQISSAQLALFRLLIDGDGHLMVDNFRPPLSLGTREIEKGSETPHWDYGSNLGPSNWGTDFPLCSGTSQSPIDIVTANAIGQYPFQDANFKNYNVPPTSLKLKNNGHTIQASFVSASPISVLGLDLPDEYILAQFHFHWGSDDTQGSEHLLNGQSYPMEIHFVHYKEKYGNLSESLKHSDGLAVIGFFFEIAATDNPSLTNLINGIPAIEQSYSETDITPFAFDQLFPNDLTTKYRYSGSLTTPTCNEIVTWTVYQDTIKISASQMAQFRTVLDDADRNIVDNFRPPQPLNGRKVYSGAVVPHWGYEGDEGPSNWGTLFTTCTGTRQSPIDIVTASAVTDTSYSEFVFTGYDTPPTTMEISNNGHSAKVSITATTMPTVGGGNLAGTYTFAQFHFHWGGNNTVGSEHTIDGTSYPNELHLVHYKTSYGNLSEAIKNSDGLAVLGIFLTVDAADNPNLAPIITGLQQVVDSGDHASVTPFALQDLLPANKKEFYRYLGSLTTPTCNEVVIWTVFKDAITISQSQLDTFRALLDALGHPLINNYRPVQPLSGRTVTFADIP